MTIIKQSFTFLLFCLISTTLNAGEVVEVTSKDLTAKNPTEETLKFFFSDGFMKMNSDEDSDFIFNGNDSNMMVISHSNKTYMVFDQSTASNIKNEIDKVMEEALAQVPPEQRAMVEQMMKKQMQGMGAAPQAQAEEPKTEIREAGRSDIINGYACDYYEAYNSNQKDAEFCIASWSSIGASDNIQKSFIGMSEFMEGFLKQISQLAPMKTNDNPFAYMKEMNGYPVFTRNFSKGAATDETTLKSITQQDIDKSFFIAPADYTKQDIMGM